MGLELISFYMERSSKQTQKKLQNDTKLTLNINSIQFKDFFVLEKS
jgi:hypothetical protein